MQKAAQRLESKMTLGETSNAAPVSFRQPDTSREVKALEAGDPLCSAATPLSVTLQHPDSDKVCKPWPPAESSAEGSFEIPGELLAALAPLGMLVCVGLSWLEDG